MEYMTFSQFRRYCMENPPKTIVYDSRNDREHQNRTDNTRISVRFEKIVFMYAPNTIGFVNGRNEIFPEFPASATATVSLVKNVQIERTMNGIVVAHIITGCRTEEQAFTVILNY